VKHGCPTPLEILKSLKFTPAAGGWGLPFQTVNLLIFERLVVGGESPPVAGEEPLPFRMEVPSLGGGTPTFGQPVVTFDGVDNVPNGEEPPCRAVPPGWYGPPGFPRWLVLLGGAEFVRGLPQPRTLFVADPGGGGAEEFLVCGIATGFEPPPGHPGGGEVPPGTGRYLAVGFTGGTPRWGPPSK